MRKVVILGGFAIGLAAAAIASAQAVRGAPAERAAPTRTVLDPFSLTRVVVTPEPVVAPPVVAPPLTAPPVVVAPAVPAVASTNVPEFVADLQIRPPYVPQPRSAYTPRGRN